MLEDRITNNEETMEEMTVRVYLCPICGHLRMWESVGETQCTCGNTDVDWMVMGTAILRYDIEELKERLDSLDSESGGSRHGSSV